MSSRVLQSAPLVMIALAPDLPWSVPPCRTLEMARLIAHALMPSRCTHAGWLASLAAASASVRTEHRYTMTMQSANTRRHYICIVVKLHYAIVLCGAERVKTISHESLQCLCFERRSQSRSLAAEDSATATQPELCGYGDMARSGVRQGRFCPPSIVAALPWRGPVS